MWFANTGPAVTRHWSNVCADAEMVIVRSDLGLVVSFLVCNNHLLDCEVCFANAKSTTPGTRGHPRNIPFACDGVEALPKVCLTCRGMNDNSNLLLSNIVCAHTFLQFCKPTTTHSCVLVCTLVARAERAGGGAQRKLVLRGPERCALDDASGSNVDTRLVFNV